jgi:hypothetical protein
MPNDDWPFDAKLDQRIVNQLGLPFYRVFPMLRSLTMPVARTIKHDNSVMQRERCQYRQPVIRRTRIAVNQHDRPPHPLDNVMQARAINGDKT